MFVFYVNVQQRASTREPALSNHVDKMTPTLIFSLLLFSATLILAQWACRQATEIETIPGLSNVDIPYQDWTDYCQS